jgi:two-component system sensor histidine kinase CpxA
VVHRNPADRYWIGIRTLMPTQDGTLQPAAVLASTPSLWRALVFLGAHQWLHVLATWMLVCTAAWAPLIWWVCVTRPYLIRAGRSVESTLAETPNLPHSASDLDQVAAAINVAAKRLREFEQGQKHFVASLSHEISSTLGRLRLSLEIVEDRVSLQDPTLFAEVHEELSRVSELVEGLLDYWRVSLIEGRPQLAVLALDELVATAIAQERATGCVSVGVPAQIQVWGNAQLLEHAIANLIRNALHHASDVADPVELRAECDGHLVRLRVMDRGPGVPQPALLNLGQPFFRVGRSSERHGGLGLGLSIVKDCVAACRGTVLFRNREGGGFEVEIVLHGATPQPRAVPTSLPALPAVRQIRR